MIRKALLFVLILTTVAFADWETVEDHWYGLTIAGAKSGWMHSTIEQDGSLIRTTSTQQLEISRGGMVIEIEVSTEFVEEREICMQVQIDLPKCKFHPFALRQLVPLQ